jgi:hypothetical protein
MAMFRQLSAYRLSRMTVSEDTHGEQHLERVPAVTRKAKHGRNRRRSSVAQFGL